MNSIKNLIGQYSKNQFEDWPDFMLDIKEKAKEWLLNDSCSINEEKYKYTQIAPLLENKTISRLTRNDFPSSMVSEILDSDIPDIDSYSVILVNGYSLNNEPVHELQGGVILGSLVHAVKRFGHLFRTFFENYRSSEDFLVNLNTMLSEGGFFLFVPANCKPAKPIQIINLLSGNHSLIQPRNLVLMEAGSSADLLICDYTLSGEHSFVCNDATEVVCGENSSLNITKLQDVHESCSLISHTTVDQKASSKVKTHYFSIKGGTIRNNLTAVLGGQKSEHIAEGLSYTQHAEHIDHQVQITHAHPDCHSNQLFKHILADESTGAFTGRIIVAKDAQKTLAYQKSNNILLNPKAKMNIRPQLEIYADDVKCSHGATVGQLDEEALFYLRSRGISKDEARKILLHAFAGEVIGDIHHESIRLAIEKLMTQRMGLDLNEELKMES